MAQNFTSDSKIKKALILSDGRKGHENQSIAFCQLKGFDYDIVSVSYKSKIFKALSYLLDFLGLNFKIFESSCDKGDNETPSNAMALNSNDFINFADFDLFVSAGSTTYYALKFYAKRYGKPSVALMYPRGYRKNFSVIIAGAHDHPAPRANLVVSPVSLSFSRPIDIYAPARKAIGFIIGGPNSAFEMDEKILRQIEEVRAKFSDFEFALTTSPRTPREIEGALGEMEWDFSLIYSQNPLNPIGDFLNFCEWVFISEDSVSMISEAVCNGRASVAILPLNRKNTDNKFDDFTRALVSSGHVRDWNSHAKLKKTAKYDLKTFVEGIKI